MRFGFDWRWYLDAVNDRPWLAAMLGLAYESFQLQLIVVPVALGFTGRTRALRTFVLSFALAAFVTVLVSAFVPAVEMWVHLGLHPADFLNIPSTGADHRAAVLRALRYGTDRSVALDNIEGIITFPSFHSVVAVLVAACLWPIRILRWPALALDVLMLAATPIYGGHYLVDVMAGTAVAVASLASARLVCARFVGAGRAET